MPQKRTDDRVKVSGICMGVDEQENAKQEHKEGAQKEMPRDPMVDDLQSIADVGGEWLRVKRRYWGINNV